MSRKPRKKYVPKGHSVPMLINRLVHETVEALEENAMFVAFKYGVATKENYDYLIRMANMLNVANQVKPSIDAMALSVNINVLGKRIFERYQRVGKIGVTGEELNMMREIVGAYDAYWKLQTTSLYNKCVRECNAFYLELAEKRKAA